MICLIRENVGIDNVKWEIPDLMNEQAKIQDALEGGSGSRAVSYIELQDGEGRRRFGVGIDTSISLASFRAVLSALNRLQA
jgi:hypothetical protein